MMKELALQTIKELPDTVEMEEIIEILYLRMKVEQGLKDVENGNVTSHEDFKKELNEYVSRMV